MLNLPGRDWTDQLSKYAGLSVAVRKKLVLLKNVFGRFVNAILYISWLPVPDSRPAPWIGVVLAAGFFWLLPNIFLSAFNMMLVWNFLAETLEEWRAGGKLRI